MKRDRYLGVRFATHGPHAGKFVATLNHKKQRTFCGAFTDPIPAARARDREAIARYGLDAELNFPEDYKR